MTKEEIEKCKNISLNGLVEGWCDGEPDECNFNDCKICGLWKANLDSNLIKDFFSKVEQLQKENEEQKKILDTLKFGIKTKEVSYSYPEPSEITIEIELTVMEMQDEYLVLKEWLEND